MAASLKHVEKPPLEGLAEATFVGRWTSISEYPFWCQMAVRFIYLPAQIVCVHHPIKIARWLYKKWGYSVMHTHSICTTKQIARGFAGRFPRGFFDTAPVDECLPMAACHYGAHEFPNSDMPIQIPNLKLVGQPVCVCEQINEVADKILEQTEMR